ncbi:MAG: 3-hydroxyacyl-ACP dehydratase FabZ [Elusimicrobiota bacterium]
MRRSVLNKEKIKKILPYRDPFLMIDECSVEEKGRSGRGLKKVSGKEYFFEGHFPGRPVMPGVLIIEAIAQTAMIVYGGGDLKLRGIKKIKFRQTIEPGDIVLFKVRFVKKEGNEIEFASEVYIDDSIAASGEIILSLNPGH